MFIKIRFVDFIVFITLVSGVYESSKICMQKIRQEKKDGKKKMVDNFQCC